MFARSIVFLFSSGSKTGLRKLAYWGITGITVDKWTFGKINAEFVFKWQFGF